MYRAWPSSAGKPASSSKTASVKCTTVFKKKYFMSQFDQIIDRKGTRALKLEKRSLLFGTNDVLPLWVADMDFAAAPAIQKALKQRMEHPIYGYTVRPTAFFEAIQSWNKRRHNWEIAQEWIEFTPGVVPSLGLARSEERRVGKECRCRWSPE